MWVNGIWNKDEIVNESDILRHPVEILDMPTMNFDGDGCGQAGCDLCYNEEGLPIMNYHVKPVQKTDNTNTGVEILDMPTMKF